MTSTVTMTDADFDTVVLGSAKPVLVDFWAVWCGPCKQVAPILDEIAGEQDGLVVAKLNVDESPVTAASQGITSIPTLNVYSGGQLVKQIVESRAQAGAAPRTRRLPRLSRTPSAMDVRATRGDSGPIVAEVSRTAGPPGLPDLRRRGQVRRRDRPRRAGVPAAAPDQRGRRHRTDHLPSPGGSALAPWVIGFCGSQRLIPTWVTTSRTFSAGCLISASAWEESTGSSVRAPTRHCVSSSAERRHDRRRYVRLEHRRRPGTSGPHGQGRCPRTPVGRTRARRQPHGHHRQHDECPIPGTAAPTPGSRVMDSSEAVVAEDLARRIEGRLAAIGTQVLLTRPQPIPQPRGGRG